MDIFNSRGDRERQRKLRDGFTISLDGLFNFTCQPATGLLKSTILKYPGNVTSKLLNFPKFLIKLQSLEKTEVLQSAKTLERQLIFARTNRLSAFRGISVALGCLAQVDDAFVWIWRRSDKL